MSANDPWSWVIGGLFVFVGVMCFWAAFEQWWQIRNARERQARDDKAVRTWMDGQDERDAA